MKGMITMSDPYFKAFERKWNYDAFMEGAFGSPMDFDEYLDDPETGAGDPIFDYFVDEITDYMLPTDIELEEWKF